MNRTYRYRFYRMRKVDFLTRYHQHAKVNASKISFLISDMLNYGGNDMMGEREKWILAAFEENGPILRGKQLRELGADSRAIRQLIDKGKLVRLKDGYYVREEDYGRMSDDQMAASVIPGGVVFYLSAAARHGLTTLIPQRIYIAVPNKGVVPMKPKHPPIEIFRLSPRLYELGLTMSADGIAIYDREKTVCDIARHWQDAGKDILLEVIRNYISGAKDLQKLYAYSEIMRVQHRIHPYVEAMVWFGN